MNPYLQFANANALAFSSFLISSEEPAQNKLSELWQHSMEKQLHLLNESTQACLKLLAETRVIMTGQAARLAKQAEHAASHLAHSAVRAVAIASHSRKEQRDRRVFPLPLPNGQRRDDDRRQSLKLVAKTASL